jgi:hypothetical protein
MNILRSVDSVGGRKDMESVEGITGCATSIVNTPPDGVADFTGRVYIVVVVLAFGSMVWAGPQVVAYATKVAFRQAVPIQFEDFQLMYLGQHREVSNVYPRGFLYYDFRVISGTQELKVSWTAGTGEIGPTRFEVSGKRYLLELAWSEAVGRLKNDELVVRRAESVQ